MTLQLDNDETVNWIADLERAAGRLPPKPPPGGARAELPAGEMLAYEGQPRDKGGKFGHGKLNKPSGAAAPTKQQQEAGLTAAGQLVAPDSMGDFNDIGQAAILKRAASISEKAAALSPEGAPRFPTTVEEMAAVTRSVYDRATPEQIEAGKVWYQDTHDQLQKWADQYPPATLDQACAITARCSPGRRWEGNLELTNRILEVHGKDEPFDVTPEVYAKLDSTAGMRGPGSYRPSELTPEQVAFAHPGFKPADQGGWDRPQPVGYTQYGGTEQVADSIRLLRGETTIDQLLVGPKVRNFYNNMRRPDDPFSVTIDLHMIHAQVPHGITLPGRSNPDDPIDQGHSEDTTLPYYQSAPQSGPGGIPPRVGMYPMFGSAAQQVARDVGLLPQQVQAIIWLVERDRKD